MYIRIKSIHILYARESPKLEGRLRIHKYKPGPIKPFLSTVLYGSFQFHKPCTNIAPFTLARVYSLVVYFPSPFVSIFPSLHLTHSPSLWFFLIENVHTIWTGFYRIYIYTKFESLATFYDFFFTYCQPQLQNRWIRMNKGYSTSPNWMTIVEIWYFAYRLPKPLQCSETRAKPSKSNRLKTIEWWLDWIEWAISDIFFNSQQKCQKCILWSRWSCF